MTGYKVVFKNGAILDLRTTGLIMEFEKYKGLIE